MRDVILALIVVALLAAATFPDQLARVGRRARVLGGAALLVVLLRLARRPPPEPAPKPTPTPAPEPRPEPSPPPHTPARAPDEVIHEQAKRIERDGYDRVDIDLFLRRSARAHTDDTK